MKNWILHMARPGGYWEDWYIRKILGGERYLAAFEHRTRALGTSTGTTAKPKLIPFTSDFLGQDHRHVPMDRRHTLKNILWR